MPAPAFTALYATRRRRNVITDDLLPYTSATECIEALYSLNQMAQGTNMPVVPREALRGIVERDALGLLGLG